MNCANCGNSLPLGARVCPNCGTPVPNVFPTPPGGPAPEPTVYGNFGPFRESGPTNPPTPAAPDNAAQQGPPAMPQEFYSATGYGIPSPPQQYQPPAQQPFPPNQQPFSYPSQQPPMQQPPFVEFGSPQQAPASGMSNMPPNQQQPFMPGGQQPFAQPGQSQYPQQPFVQPGQPQYPQQQSYPGFPQQPSFPGMPPQQFSDTTQQNAPIGNPPSFPGVPPQQPSYPGQPGQYGQQGQFGQPGQMEQPARRRPPGLIIALIIVAVLVIIGGSGLIYYLGVARPKQLSDQATATAVNKAQGTAAANAHATGTAQAQANATVTAVAVATAQVQATMTAYVSMYTQATSGTPALNDSLAQNDASNWSVYSNSAGACAFTGGALHVTGTGATCVAQATNFGDFAFQAKMTILKGSSSAEGGLVFRLDGTTFKYYIFGIGTDGTYSLLLLQAVSATKVTVKPLTTGFSSAITQGFNQTNTLAILARGSNFYLYANNQFITQFSDSNSSAGAIGLVGADNVKGIDVAFTNAELWRV